MIKGTYAKLAGPNCLKAAYCHEWRQQL